LLDVYDTLMNLKREAADLEDANRTLQEQLRFKSDKFNFINPFWYENKYPGRPLCAKCFANGRIGPMSEKSESYGVWSRNCLVCSNTVYL